MMGVLNTLYADIYVGYPVDGPFTYIIPERMNAAPGSRVRVNFNGRNIVGFVHKVHHDEPTNIDREKLKEITSLIDEIPIFDTRLIELARYISLNYLCTIGEALAMALPSGAKPSKRYKNPYAGSEKKM